jgi:hypothetical protein
LNPDSVTGLLARVAQVRMTQPIGTTQEDSFGMDAPQATITLTVQEQKVTQPAETGASGQAGVVQLSTPVGTEAASPTPPPTPTVETVETMYTLRIGAKLDGGDYAFIASNSTYYVQVSASTAEGILNLNHDSFLVGQATPTPTAETGAAPAPETTATPASPVPEITATLALEAMPTPVPEASATLSSGS